jgi:hypothetical protein
VRSLSYGASLDRREFVRTIHSVPHPRFFATFSSLWALSTLSTVSTLLAETVAADVHRYQESIAGHPYLIEVTPVSRDRWRAYIVRIPGVPTALMPFYGATPAEAARQLCDWLTRAHRQAASSSGTV